MQDTFFSFWGTVSEISAFGIKIEGFNDFIGVGDEIRIACENLHVLGEILHIGKSDASALLFENANAIRIGDRVSLQSSKTIQIGPHWQGAVVDYRGLPMTEQASHPIAPANTVTYDLRSHEPAPHKRRAMGARLNTGLQVTDTLLPICKGQRIGLFAGSGVGKSSLILNLAKGLDADRVIIALIGERSREISDFARALFKNGLENKATIIAATASDPPGTKKRAALSAMAAAEYYRDQGEHVLFLFDSITRFAEAHREVALMGGETPALNAFPPSTVRVISELAERAGPGAAGQGDITAIFSVLVAGSDMEEPVADMIRGILDGHIILSRDIAERGRYPAIDVLRSVSRSLPHAATPEENALIREYRTLIATYDRILPMIRADLYVAGQDEVADKAIRLFEDLDAFVSAQSDGPTQLSFDVLRTLLTRSET
jgi:flagellum-specific ATP synthase